MALKDIKIPTVEVPVGQDSSFAVRGLSTSDIEVLVRRHGSDLRQLFDEYVNGADLTKLNFTQLTPMLKKIVGRLPGLITDVIAIGADADEDDMKILNRLPGAAQVAAVSNIITMTLSVNGEMGNGLEMVIKALASMNGGLGEILKVQANA